MQLQILVLHTWSDKRLLLLPRQGERCFLPEEVTFHSASAEGALTLGTVWHCVMCPRGGAGCVLKDAPKRGEGRRTQRTGGCPWSWGCKSQSAGGGHASPSTAHSVGGSDTLIYRQVYPSEREEVQEDAWEPRGTRCRCLAWPACWHLAESPALAPTRPRASLRSCRGRFPPCLLMPPRLPAKAQPKCLRVHCRAGLLFPCSRGCLQSQGQLLRAEAAGCSVGVPAGVFLKRSVAAK